MTIVPKKYHTFISPPLRRVFLGNDGGQEGPSAAAVIADLNAEIAALKVRVGSLVRDKGLLMDRCEAAQSALARLNADERAARLARRHDARLATLNLERLKDEYDALSSR